MNNQQQKVCKDLRAALAESEQTAVHYERQAAKQREEAHKWYTLYLETEQDRSKYKLWTYVQLVILAAVAVKTVVQLINGA